MPGPTPNLLLRAESRASRHGHRLPLWNALTLKPAKPSVRPAVPKPSSYRYAHRRGTLRRGRRRCGVLSAALSVQQQLVGEVWIPLARVVESLVAPLPGAHAGGSPRVWTAPAGTVHVHVVALRPVLFDGVYPETSGLRQAPRGERRRGRRRRLAPAGRRGLLGARDVETNLLLRGLGGRRTHPTGRSGVVGHALRTLEGGAGMEPLETLRNSTCARLLSTLAGALLHLIRESLRRPHGHGRARHTATLQRWKLHRRRRGCRSRRILHPGGKSHVGHLRRRG